MRDALRKLDGLFVGQLTADEMELFRYGVKKGWCHSVYDGVAGFLGLARVKVNG